jgi:hypothetical protein
MFSMLIYALALFAGRALPLVRVTWPNFAYHLAALLRKLRLI